MSSMVHFEKLFRMYCEENSLTINLSFDMPDGYETANGTFDPTVNTLFTNKEMLQSQPEYEQMFYLFHELRHASQYLHPEHFDELIARSRLYVIQYEGTCYKLVDCEWRKCKLDGPTEYFSELYLGQPYERDANDFAYERVKALLGDSPELQELHAFWTPKKVIEDQAYEELYRRIDEMTGESKMKKKIEVFDYSEQIMKALRKGILLNTYGDKFNSMVISWGHFGIIWGKPTFAVYVRENRYTKAQLDKTGEFTISIPLNQPDPHINKICGMQSGRNIDKVKEAGLTLTDPVINHTPAIAEYPLTLECKVLYSQKHDLSFLPEDIRKNDYPANVDGTAPLANRDPHTVYIGEIVNAYIIENE